MPSSRLGCLGCLSDPEAGTLGLCQTRLEAAEGSPPILQICSGKDSGKTMGNSKDKDELATASLTLPTHTPLSWTPRPQKLLLAPLGCPLWGRGLCQALLLPQGHLSWLKLLFLLRGMRQSVAPALSVSAVSMSPQGASGNLTGCYASHPLVPWWWSGIPNTQFRSCSFILHVQPPAPCF